MRTITVFASLYLLLSVPLKAQTTDSLAIKKYYEENTILWLGSGKYFKGLKSFPLRNLKNEIRYSPDAKYEFDQYRNSRKIYTGILIAGDALLISSLFVKDRDTKFGLLLGSVITFSIGIPVSISSTRNLHRFIWLQNRDVLLR